MDANIARIPRPKQLRPVVALVAHDRRKDEMVEWALYNKGTLSRCSLYATRTTGLTLESALAEPAAPEDPAAGEDRTPEQPTMQPIHLLLSGPMGGDAQLGALIAEGRIDVVVFFWDPLMPQPHDVDVKALLRLAVLHDVPIACNRSSADYLISSPLFVMPEKYREDRSRSPDFAPWAR
jgi:methylglyoxal synthase